MGANNQKLKFLQLGFGNTESPGEIDVTFQCQVKNWQIVNNTDDGEKMYSYCYDPEASDAENLIDGEFREEATDDYALQLDLYADWRSNGISTFLWQHDQETMLFRIDHLPHLPNQHTRWDGKVKIKAPTVGGEARTTEMTSVTLPIIGKPEFTPSDELS